MSRLSCLILGAALLAACSDPAPPPARAELRVEGASFSVLPAAGQLPLCLLVEVRGGLARPLASGEDGQSIACPAGKPVAGRAFPQAQSGAHRVIVIFSDRPLRADTVALDIGDRLSQGAGASITAMDLRAPGQVTLQMLDVRTADARPAATR